MVSFPYDDIEGMRSYTILEITTLISNYKVTIERRYADRHYTGGLAPASSIPGTLENTIQWYQNSRRKPDIQCWIRSWIIFLVSKLSCRNHTSWICTRFIFCGVMIFTDRDDNPWFQTTLMMQITTPKVEEQSTMNHIHQYRSQQRLFHMEKHQLCSEHGKKCTRCDGKIPLEMNQEATCPSYAPEWDPGSVLPIRTQSWQSWDTQVLLNINYRLKLIQPIWHPK